MKKIRKECSSISGTKLRKRFNVKFQMSCKQLLMLRKVNIYFQRDYNMEFFLATLFAVLCFFTNESKS